MESNALLITNGPIKSALHFCVLVLNVAAEGANKLVGLPEKFQVGWVLDWLIVPMFLCPI